MTKNLSGNIKLIWILKAEYQIILGTLAQKLPGTVF